MGRKPCDLKMTKINENCFLHLLIRLYDQIDMGFVSHS